MKEQIFKKSKIKKYLFLITRIFLFIIISFIIGISVYTWNAKKIKGDIFPMPFNIGISVVLTGSMEPTIDTNDLIIVKKTNDYQVNDTIVYQLGNSLIVHRIINIEEDTIITKGDANNTEDSPINISQIKGEVVIKINGLGLVIKFLKSLYGKLLILLIAILLIYYSYKIERKEEQEKIKLLKEEIQKLKQ